MARIADEAPGRCDIWDCRTLDHISHAPGLVHEQEIENGLPNYVAQNEGLIRVTLCASCHPMIPGHMNIEPEGGFEQYFDTADLDALVEQLPRGLTSPRFEALMQKAIRGRYNPARDHAGETLRLSLAYQLDRDEWKPDRKDVLDDLPDSTWVERYEEAYSDDELDDG